MEKTLFEQMDGTYEQQGDYLIPCFTLPTEVEKQIGLFGQRHLRYLKEHRKIVYINLLTSGRLNSYLADIDKQAEKLFEMLTEQMKQAQCITEQLKAENALEWVGLSISRQPLKIITNRYPLIVTNFLREVSLTLFAYFSCFPPEVLDLLSIL